MRRTTNDYQRIVNLLATNDVCSLCRLLVAALRRGARPHAILSQLQQAIDGVYLPRGKYSDRELDIASLLKAIGGPRLLYALNHSHGLPSLRSVNRAHPLARLQPCVGIPTRAEIAQNIDALFNAEHKIPAPKTSSGKMTGQILMVDGVALEEKCRYLQDRDCVVEICREHAGRVKTRVGSLEAVDALCTALHGKDDSKKCCDGKDATVAALAPYARTDHYSPTPLLVSPSCKSETGVELAAWLRRVLQVWEDHPSGACIHGSIWALASDGESSFRLAKALLCLSEPLDKSSSLGRLLYKMVGLNCRTGIRCLCATCDSKHVIKRRF